MPLSTTTDELEQQHRVLADEYAALRLELTGLHLQPTPDLVAIDATMKKIDAVQMALKATHSRCDDPQRF